VLALLLAACGQVAPPEPESVPAEEEQELETENIGTSGYDDGTGLATDSDGNVYVVGNTQGALHGSSGSDGNSNGFLRKYNSSNQLLWGRQINLNSGVLYSGTAGRTFAHSVSVDEYDKSIYVVGSYHNPTTSVGQAFHFKGFVRKYSSSGKVLFTRKISISGSNLHLRGSAVISSSGNLFVVGDSHHESNGGSRAYIRSYDWQGNTRWTKQFRIGSKEDAQDVAVDGNGNAVMVGNYYNSNNAKVSFLRKYTSSGAVAYTRQFDADAHFWEAGATGVAIDSSGNIFVSGSRTQSNPYKQGAYLRKFNASGTQLWLKSTGDTGDKGYRGKDVAVDNTGNAYLLGDYQYNNSDRDVFVIKYNTSGTQLWQTATNSQWHPSSLENGTSIVTRSGSAIYVTGSTEGQIGSHKRGGVDAYLVRLNSTGGYVWAD
jgi:hypothetical protein